MTLPASDQALVDGLRARDHAAFTRVYADYHSAIFNLCARIIGDREEAKDVTQDVFITAFSRPPVDDRGDARLRPWLYRVATNACFNHLRARKPLGGDPAAIDTAAAPVDEFERVQTAALVEQSLGEMNERYRTALVLKDLHGLPATEIAEVMAVSRPAADVLVHRARAAFRAAFGRLGGDPGAAPANLGLVLAPLSVPAVLQAMPSLPIPLGAVPHSTPLPDLSSSVGPAGAGLLTKIGAALSTKIGITAAAATLAVGGGAAVYTAETHDGHRDKGVASAQTHSEGDTHESSHEWSPHDARWGAAAHRDGHGWPAGGHAGERGRHDGSWSSHDGGHTSDGSGGTSDHSSGDNGTSGTSTTHDDGGSTWSPTPDSGGDTWDTHGSDAGW